ncbi:MAG TPA: fibronectin type III domain-containing protein [Chthonomonadaceae bacterium]|nr:fibronectin type III domain-containing protein [Chthonomonadaceae bacterium]
MLLPKLKSISGLSAPLRLLLLLLLIAGSSLRLPAQVAGDPSVAGQWSNTMSIPVHGIHIHLLPTGKVLLWDRLSASQCYLWDPTTNAFTLSAQPGYNLFCAGHAFLGDGRLFVAGGHIDNNVGLAYASIYDPFKDTWTRLPDMNAGRWYPTVTTLPNGKDVLVLSGSIDNTVGVNTLPQVWQGAVGAWRDLTTAQAQLPLYPMMFVLPNGKFLDVGPARYTRVFDVSGTGTTQSLAYGMNSGTRPYGSAVLYDTGKILALGGNDPPLNTAELLDTDAANPAWVFTGSMASARRQQNATLLPDGKVLVTGGSSGTGFSNAAAPVYSAEMWDPATGQFTTLASDSVFLGYHSNAVLLPDGRVAVTTGDWGDDPLAKTPTLQIYSPPYLFRGPRPTIAAAPSRVSYGQTFFVGTPDAAAIRQVNWIRLTSATHAFNMNQRINRLSFVPTNGGLNVTAPSDPNQCPAGHYLLFLLNTAGVPSVAAMVKVDFIPIPPSGLSATAASNTEIDLAWQDNSNNEDDFVIEQSTDGAAWIKAASVNANTTHYAVPGLSGATTYYFRVRAQNADGDSDNSTIASATTRPDPPAAPSNLLAVARSRSRIRLTWTDNSANEDGFAIEQSLNGVNFQLLKIVSADTTSFECRNLATDTTYYYRVRATSAARGNSAYSNIASATTLPFPPAAPSDLTATPVSSTQIALTWKNNATNADSIRVYRSRNGVDFTRIATLSPDATTYTATFLLSATTYYFKVVAVNRGGSSPPSNIASTATLPK